MAYRSDDGTETEQVFNSRDGVTPFVIALRSGAKATHVNWASDQRQPEGWTPPPGMRYFTDMTRDRARARAAAAWDSWAADPRWDTHLRDTYGGNREAAIAELAASYLEQPGTPDLIDPGQPGHPGPPPVTPPPDPRSSNDSSPPGPGGVRYGRAVLYAAPSGPIASRLPAWAWRLALRWQILRWRRTPDPRDPP